MCWCVAAAAAPITSIIALARTDRARCAQPPSSRSIGRSCRSSALRRSAVSAARTAPRPQPAAHPPGAPGDRSNTMYRLERRLADLGRLFWRLAWWSFDIAALAACGALWLTPWPRGAELAASLVLIASVLILWREAVAHIG